MITRRFPLVATVALVTVVTGGCGGPSWESRGRCNDAQRSYGLPADSPCAILSRDDGVDGVWQSATTMAVAVEEHKETITCYRGVSSLLASWWEQEPTDDDCRRVYEAAASAGDLPTVLP